MSTRRLSTLISIGGTVAGSLGSAVRTASSSLGSIGGQIRALQARQRGLQERTEAYTRAGRNVGDLQRQYARVGRQIETLQRQQTSLNEVTRNYQRAQRDAAAARGRLMDAAGVGAAISAPVVVAAAFESRMARVGALARATDEDLSLLTATARELGATTEWSASQVGEGMEYLTLAGFSIQETIAAMPGLLSLSTAGATELGEASGIASGIMRGFGIEASQLQQVADTLTNTFTTSNTTLDSLGYTMSYVAPIAAATGVSLEETAAAAGLLGNANIQGMKAGTALRAILSRLSAPTTEAAATLEQLGIATADADGNLRPFGDLLRDIEAATRSMGTAARQDVVATLFGLEAASAGTILLGHAASGALDSYTASLSRTGTAQEVAARQLDTTRGRWLVLRSAIEENAIILGNALLPAVNTILEGLTRVAVVVSGLATRFPRTTQAIVVMVAILGALFVAVTAATYAFNLGRVALFASRAGWIQVARILPMIANGFRAVAMAVMANPVVAIITAIAVAAFLIWRNWEPIKAWFIEFWGQLRLLAVYAWELWQELFAWSPLGRLLGGWEPINAFFDSFWSGVGSVASAAWDGIKFLFRWSPIGLLYRSFAPVRRFFDTLWDGVKTAAAAVFGWIGRQVERVGAMVHNLTGGWLDDVERVDEHGNPITDATSSAPAPVALPTSPAPDPLAEFAQAPAAGAPDGGFAGLPDGFQIGSAAAQPAAPSYQIVVNGSDQESSEHIARLVVDMIDERERRSGGSAMHDRP